MGSNGSGRRCPVCGGEGRVVLDLPSVPVFCNVLWPTRAGALEAPRGAVRLAVCTRCGMAWNGAFDPSLVAYAPGYENALHFSATFQAYATALADRLVEDYDVRGGSVVEIGAGDGAFLSLLCARGGNRGIGFDPSVGERREVDAAPGAVTLVPEHFTPDTDVAADLVCCRHVLEHVPDPLRFLRDLRRAPSLRPGTVLYFEVPAAEWVLGHGSVWDVIYEHPSIFGEAALRLVFETAGFVVLDSGLAFGGQYAWVEAAVDVTERAREPARATTTAVDAARVRDDWAGKLADWDARLSALLAGGPVAVWGAGSKGVTFLNLLAAGADVPLVVDVNPRKHGLHVPGTGQRVASPHELAGRHVATILVMNPVYEAEIRAEAARAGLEAEVVVV